MKSVATKLLLFIGIATILFSVFLLYHTYSLTNRWIREAVEQQASMALKFDLAIRNYVGQHVRPLMYELVGEDEFVPETMSTSYVAQIIFEDVRNEFPDYIIKFSSDNPRNPANQAGPEELEIIEYLNNNPHLKRWSGQISIGGKQFMAKFSARRMKESCLHCHGDPADAPASLLERYGTTAGFHRPIGEIIGLDTVAIPMTKVTEKLWSESIKTFIVGGLGLLLFFLCIIFTIRFLVTNRLTKIAQYFATAARQTSYSRIEPIEVSGRDEISDLASGFNILSDKLRHFYSSLEMQVKERTKKLEHTNEQLRREVEDRMQAEKALRESEAKYRELFSTESDAIMVLDVDSYQFTDVNDAALRLYGYSKDEFLKLKPTDISEEPEKSKVAIKDTVAGKINKIPLRYHKKKDGTVFPVEISFGNFVLKNRRLICAVIRDISERRRTQEELQKTKEAAEAANRAKSTFLANMSHELRTPLNAIIGYSEMLMEDAEDQDQEAFIPDLERIHASGKHLLVLINDILDLSKVEAGKMDLYLETFGISAMVENVVNTVQPMGDKNANTLEIHCPGDLGLMYADMTKVRQVLFNLLSNACKFTERGTISLDVVRERVNDLDWLIFRVSDTGIGITSEQMGKLFQAFSQVHPSTTGEYAGTGLGLLISKRFCHMMGGEITVESEYGVGSTFTVRLPAEVKIPEPESVAPTEHRVEPLPEGTSTVLVIDDDPTVLDLMKRFLSKEGLRVETASRGEEGLKLAKKLHPGAITLDVLMPGMDGWAVLSALKADPELVDIPVVMLTIVDNKNMGYTLGASDYLNKPIDRNRLVNILQKYRTESPPFRVLVVEDDAKTREMLRRMLEKDGCTVTEAENGRVALERIAKAQPAVILLDLMMPEMDGFEFVAELRKDETWRSTPVVVITAKDLTPEDRLRLNGYVEKILQKGAYSREELLDEVRDLVAACVRRRNAVKV